MGVIDQKAKMEFANADSERLAKNGEGEIRAPQQGLEGSLKMCKACVK